MKRHLKSYIFDGAFFIAVSKMKHHLETNSTLLVQNKDQVSSLRTGLTENRV